ncbi:zinc-dependent alcohol dehydrogenase family protein [Microbacterium sp. zg.B48]|uniref:zinc-dependent alcohol dehydrogenase family protein n=1 Tax=Microbacterium sp. zg.B48 TaxID=2969408 RepID=UPI00214C6F89|nr:zinc-dependent alcohol dehydrogenase family protein [Microbacterium sp. zg.B48]MCR2762813.1 zinc-dependent alcohol dehydrogenase family protein [Microbacterium sp. zg.B48]
MKAIVFREGSQWAVEDVPTPEPARGEVLLEVIRTGVCGTDEHLLHGGFIAKLPLIPGHEILGRVVALGEGVTSPAVGTVVTVDNTIHCGECGPCLTGRALFCENFVSLGCNEAGGFAEYVAVRAAKTFSADGLDVATAGLAEPTACAMHGADMLALKPGSEVLIFGAGPTGLILAQLLKTTGAARVVVAAPTASKLALAKEFGADETVQMDRGNADAAEAALRALAPNGFDAVVEATGSTAVLELGIRLTATGGTVLVYGLAGEDATASIRPYEIFSRELTIKGSFAQAFTMQRSMTALRSGAIKTEGIVTDVVGFDDFSRALSNLGDSSQVKTVFEPGKGL